MAERKRPEERPSRLVIEYYGPGEAELVLAMRHDALELGQPVREWVLQAIRERLERRRQQRAARELPRVADDDGPPYDPHGGERR